MAGGGGTLGGMPLMNNGTNGATPRVGNDNEQPDYEARLHHFIYDYFLKNENWECARALITSGLAMDPPPRPNDSDVNGAADGSMHTDSKDGLDSKRPSDLPSAGVQPDQQGNSFLLEWFALFWDVYFAQKKNVRATQHANLYVQHSQVRSRKDRRIEATLTIIVAGTIKNASRATTGTSPRCAWHDECRRYELRTDDSDAERDTADEWKRLATASPNQQRLPGTAVSTDLIFTAQMP